MSARQIDREHLGELECPVCKQCMSSPIKMCENGHNVCGGCKERLSDCPICRWGNINGQNFVLERFAIIAFYPYKNKEAGCKETFILERSDSHPAQGLLQSRECLFRKLSGVDWPWTGTVSDIAVHILDEHECHIAEVQAHFKVEQLDFDVGRPYRRAVLTLGSYFTWLGKQTARYLSLVISFGPKNLTNPFKYGIKMGNSAEYVTVNRKCHSYLDGGLKDNQPGMFVALHCGTIQECLVEHGDFSC